MPAVLEKERRAYEQHKSELLKTHPGQFALVHEEEFVGTFTTFNEAYQEGVRRFGLRPFLVQQIQTDEPMAQIPALVVGILSSR